MDALSSELAVASAIVRALYIGLPCEALLRRPAPDAWRAPEVLCHQCHGERYDFFPRLEATSFCPAEPCSQADREGWLAADCAGPPELEQTLDAWAAQRAESLAWLHILDAPHWDDTPRGRRVRTRAGDDVLQQHLLVGLRYGRVAELAAPYGLCHASEW